MSEADLSEAELQDLIELIEIGFPNSDIQQYFPGLSFGSIVAYRAHVTRGTYNGGFDESGRNIKHAKTNLRGR